MIDVQKNEIVLDPFTGVGTPPLTCKQNGIKAIGFDVSPLTAFVADVKTRHYNLDDLEKYVRVALKWKFEKPKSIPREKWLKKVIDLLKLE